MENSNELDGPILAHLCSLVLNRAQIGLVDKKGSIKVEEAYKGSNFSVQKRSDLTFFGLKMAQMS